MCRYLLSNWQNTFLSCLYGAGVALVASNSLARNLAQLQTMTPHYKIDEDLI